MPSEPNGATSANGGIQRRIRNDVADLVQIGAEPALLVELARQHAVDRVERHAHEEPYRDDEEHPTQEASPGRKATDQIDPTAAAIVTVFAVTPRSRQRGNQGAKQVLKAGLQRVERHRSATLWTRHLVMRGTDHIRLTRRLG